MSLQIVWGLLKGKTFTGYVDRNKRPLFVGDTYTLYSYTTGEIISTQTVDPLMAHPTIPEYFDYFLPMGMLIEKK